MAPTSDSTSRLSFWHLQLGGWCLYALAIATSNLPFRHKTDLVAFRATFLLSAFLASFLMYLVCRTLRLRNTALVPAVVICMVGCAVLGFGCYALSMWSEIRLGGSPYPFTWATAFSGITSGAFVLVAWCAIYFGIKQYQERERERRQLRAAESSARDAQLLALRYQLQPHFLFNTLNAISSLIVSDKPHLATDMIAGLGDLLRSTLDGPETHFVSLAEELIVVKQYLAIEEIRFGSPLRVLYDVAVETLPLQVPRFLLQPLIENAVRHGISHLAAGGQVSLQTKVQAESLMLRIENDKASTPRALEAPSGLGLANTRERLLQIYGADASITVANYPGETFRITLILPAHRQPETAMAKELL